MVAFFVSIVSCLFLFSCVGSLSVFLLSCVFSLLCGIEVDGQWRRLLQGLLVVCCLARCFGFVRFALCAWQVLCWALWVGACGVWGVAGFGVLFLLVVSFVWLGLTFAVAVVLALGGFVAAIFAGLFQWWCLFGFAACGPLRVVG